MIDLVILPTDLVLLVLVLAGLVYTLWVCRTPRLVQRWQRVFTQPGAAAAGMLLALFTLLALVDSVHFRPLIHTQADGTAIYAPVTESLLTYAVTQGLDAAHPERSYSRPLATREFDKSTRIVNDVRVRDFHPLDAPERHPWSQATLVMRALGGALLGGVIGALLGFSLLKGLRVALRAFAPERAEALLATPEASGRGPKNNSLRSRFPAALAALLTAILFLALLGAATGIWPARHPLGTDAVGNDVLLAALQSIRTALVIGSLATLATLPFAVTLGIAAGYFKGWVDDVIQYLYTTLSSIPSVLLIAASVLMVQSFMDAHPQLWATGLERADVKLFLLALIIGLTGWSTLARLLRAETLKLSTLDFVTAARALGVSNARIMGRHILPNVLHLVLIVAVLDFSGIVLYEAVLSYVGVGVDPSMNSFGTMINAARSEMSRSPMVWWNLGAAFVFMLALVLAANVLASAVREAFDPRASLD